jgi:hypothetical protein
MDEGRDVRFYMFTLFHCMYLFVLTKPQVPQSSRQILQQLHILLRNGRQRQVPAPPPTHTDSLVREHRFAQLDLHRRQPYQSPDRGGHPEFLQRGI